jgi:hypothetical protein
MRDGSVFCGTNRAWFGALTRYRFTHGQHDLSYEAVLGGLAFKEVAEAAATGGTQQ